MRVGAACLLLAAAAGAEYGVTELLCPRQVHYRVVRDLDGDGLADILVVTTRQAWLWRGRTGAFPREPDSKLALPEGAALFDVGPPDATPQRLVVRTAAGYVAVAPGGTTPLERVSGPGLPLAPTNLLWRGFFHDLDRDGRSDFVDVSLDGYRIEFAGGDTVALPAITMETVDVRTDAASEQLVARYALGEWTHGDFDGDGRGDFAVMTRDGLTVYPGGADGRPAPGRTRVVPLEEAAEADLHFDDFNGDGRTDLLAMHRKAGRVAVLIADSERGLRAPRRIRLAIPGHIRLPVVWDLDGDGRTDIAFPYTAKPSVQDLVRVALRGEAILKVPIFLNRGGDTPFRNLADKQLTIPIRIRIGTDSAGRITLSALVVVEYGGDLDGDGRNDLMITLRPDRLGVHRGVADGVFAEEASLEIDVPDCSAFDSVKSHPANLDGDEKSDVLLHYRGAGRRPDRLLLLLSGKK